MNEILIQTKPFQKKDIKKIDSEWFNNFPIIYILHNQKKSPSAYIGQTVKLQQRMKQHKANGKLNDLKTAIFISHELFNQSATYNIESNLINYFIADQKYKLQNVSQTITSETHNYYNKQFYNEKLFQELWRKLKEKNIVSQDLLTLENKDTFKLSPYKELSNSQLDLKDKIIEFCKKYIEGEEHVVYFVKGEAGTGKSVVLSSTFNTIQDLTMEDKIFKKHTNNFMLVNHSEVLKTYKTISKSLPNLYVKQFQKPTTFINEVDSGKIKLADIVFVDEAHLLLSKKDSYNNFYYENQLEEIIKRSKVTVIFYDSKQVLKLKSYWDESKFNCLKKSYCSEEYQLTDQFRMQASEDVIDWINNFIDKQVLSLPSKNSQHKNVLVDSEFELKMFDDAEEMRKAIEEKNNKFGLSRIVSTFDYEHKKNGDLYYINEGDFSLPWNITNIQKTWAEASHTIDEVGSIYTVQGFDLNYVGVILGPSVSFDENTNSLVINIEKYHDTEAFRGREDITVRKIAEIKEQIILNSINILMKRGVKGLYMFASDENLRKKLMDIQKNRVD